MITRRSLFLGSAAVILTPNLLMPVRKIVMPPIREIGSIEGFRFIASPQMSIKGLRRIVKQTQHLVVNPVSGEYVVFLHRDRELDFY